jgi:hypothetical protein
MNRDWLVLFGAMVVVATRVGYANEESTEATLASEVNRLVLQLDARELRQRNEAEIQLRAIGPDALRHLPPEQEVESAAVRSALRRVRSALEVQAAGRDLKATVVSLEGDSIRLSEALEQITRQTGNPVVDRRAILGQPAPDPELHLRFDETPFWTALDSICQKAGLTYQPFSEGRHVELLAASPDDPSAREPVSYSGPFRVTAQRWEITEDLALANSRSYRLVLQVMWEPRLRPFFLALPMNRVTGKDDRGHRVTAANPEAQYEASTDARSLAVEVSLDLAPPDRRAQRIVDLSGALVASTAGRIETFRLDPIHESVGRAMRQGPIELTLREFRSNGPLWEALLTLRYDRELPAFDSHRSWVFSNEIFLERSDGTRIDAIAGSNADFPSLGAVEVSYQFSQVPERLDTYRLVYQAPSMVVPLSIEFEFHDLPLP